MLCAPPICRSAAPLALALAIALVPNGRTAAPRVAGPAIAESAPVAGLDPLFEIAAMNCPATKIDQRVFARLAALGITPGPFCSDAVFIRRAFLDVIGTLPTADEVRHFLSDRNPGKRTALIDQLLTRDEFADYWTMRWCDLLRVKAEFPINLWPNAAQEYHRWIFTAVRDNQPYDQFVRTLLTASGSNFRAGPVNFYRAVQSRDASGIARAVALTFMGTRTDAWPPEKLRHFAPFFSAVGSKATQEWKEEIIYFDPTRIAAPGIDATFPDGTVVRLDGSRDPREVFADWLLRRDNPVLARAFANRVWAWFFGRGIVEPADDIRGDNPPSNPELLDELAREFVETGYNPRQFFRRILVSRCYQLSSLPHTDHPAAAANFAAYPIRRLDAEVLIDALNEITGTAEQYSSAIPEPYTFIPETQRSIALPDGSITSSFLEQFGRPGRDTGEQDERNNRITASQRLHLLNSTHVQRKITQGPKLQAILRSQRPAREIVTELYLTILSRPPTEAERAAIVGYATAHDRRTVALDTVWSLINSAEFLYRH